MNEVKINTDLIKLDSFLKWCGAVSQGSEAKIFIKNGKVKVNGEVETKRSKKLYRGFIVEFEGETYKII
ncbi:RNA-binding S4 domain-containing protein [Clostridium luticellarii]|jgi:ribosome-associated protein|uniref:Ribosome-associated protein n=1 Tax=Clostridium luticellarii TaxID=1691940 RepID=A0A2T0B205_9CLOT|nr:RNA-binding S4 domain-containing protein [Clostridium luticellarii]MCI1945843.1 RNA-binding S4 domain-containing protein [Clostridium luticellarii]MCI1969175.1 RNA-binding S4 domain-containing protein [Clostridium luticellarii]MCI1996181.1 RNA-binding S4 domain-containing protein [Clostridium luticellarii]MCI2040486.1 RNA-binding S4 domain-containing protein [Clostridium luticellarii]PRR77892.1 ribosome-associated protein [Clostridium luticellarii]